MEKIKYKIIISSMVKEYYTKGKIKKHPKFGVIIE